MYDNNLDEENVKKENASETEGTDGDGSGAQTSQNSGPKDSGASYSGGDSAQNLSGNEYRYSGSSIPYNSSSYNSSSYNSSSSYGSNTGYYSQQGQYGYNSGSTGTSGTYGTGSYSNQANGASSNSNSAGSYGTYGTYGGYNTSSANAAAGGSKKAKKQKRPKKQKSGKTGLGKRIAAIVAAAVLFGAIGGATMYGVYYTANKIYPVRNNSDVDIPTVTNNISSANSVVNEEGSAGNTIMDVSAVAEAAMPAMVALTGTTTVSGSSSSLWGYGQSYEASTSGTGIIVGKNDTELLLLTNAHVVDNVNNLMCVFVDGESVSCTVKGSKSDKDIAVVAVNLNDIKSSTLSQISIAELGNSDDVVLGQEVVAIGNALGEGQSVTNGIISALNRSITVDNVTFEGLFMTNAAINSGNSGGALLSADGRVIGINFAKTSETGVEGMAYAIPVSNVRELIDSLMNRETRIKVSDSEASYLGISGVDITSAMSEYYKYPQGVQIRSVVSGSAAEAAGLGQYDIIVSFDEETISSMSELQNIMQYYKAGETVTIQYYHPEGTQYVLKSVEVTLGSKN